MTNNKWIGKIYGWAGNSQNHVYPPVLYTPYIHFYSPFFLLLKTYYLSLTNFTLFRFEIDSKFKVYEFCNFCSCSLVIELDLLIRCVLLSSVQFMQADYEDENQII